jgi:hypothetical protein
MFDDLANTEAAVLRSRFGADATILTFFNMVV